MKGLVLVGGGGHCRSCIDVIEQQNEYVIKGIVDLPENKGREVYGYKVFATDDDLPVLVKKNIYFLITVGQVESASLRKQLYTKIMQLGGQFPAVISPRAYVSPHSKIGKGSIIMHDVVMNAGVTIGDNCIINTKALLEHDVSIGNHCHISTGAIVNGGVNIRDEVFIGSAAVCVQGIHIGNGAFVGCNQRVSGNV